MLRFTILVYLLFSHIYTVWAQADTIDMQTHKVISRQLLPTRRQYLVYMKFPQKNNLITNLSLWTREVTFEKQGGKEVVMIHQQWSGQDTLTNRKVWSICAKDNFKPLYHYTYMPKVGVEAFNFEKDRISGADTVSKNTKHNFQLVLNHPTFNWELDLETFEMLPLKEGKTFMINFYHPGGSREPAYYLYKVTGSEKIYTSTNQEVDCWKLRIDYTQDSYATFWITKKQPEVLKMEEYYKGMYRYKIKLTTVI